MAISNYNIRSSAQDAAMSRVRAMREKNNEFIRRSNEAMRMRQQMLEDQQKALLESNDKEPIDAFGGDGMERLGMDLSNDNDKVDPNNPNYNVSEVNNIDTIKNNNNSERPSESKISADGASGETAVPTMAKVGNAYNNGRRQQNQNSAGRNRQTRTYCAVGSPYNQPHYPGMNNNPHSNGSNGSHSKPQQHEEHHEHHDNNGHRPNNNGPQVAPGLFAGLKNNPLLSLFSGGNGKDKKSPVDAIKNMTGGVLDNIKGFLGNLGIKLDGENSLILLVIFVLASENKDPMLILALAYLLL